MLSSILVNSKETCILLCTHGCKGGSGSPSCCSLASFNDKNCVQCALGGACKTCKKGFVYHNDKCRYKYPKHKCNRDIFKGVCRCVKLNKEIDEYTCV